MFAYIVSLFETMDSFKFKDGRVQFGKSGVGWGGGVGGGGGVGRVNYLMLLYCINQPPADFLRISVLNKKNHSNVNNTTN